MHTLERDIKKAASLLQKAKHACALTGAGVSTESGIPDFRSKNGLWSRYDPVEYGTISAFKANPIKVWKMLAELVDIAETTPNIGHVSLAALEKENILKAIITQNIDCLHQKAGSKNVIEFHGSIATFTCLECGASSPLSDVQKNPKPPLCRYCNAVLKPDIVFFDEQIPSSALSKTQDLTAICDVLIVAGTSCQVFPASLIPSEVYSRGGLIIEINREPALNNIATVTLTGNFTAIMKKLIAYIG